MKRCRLCGRELGHRRLVRPGRQFGVVHQKCFDKWDQADEAATLEGIKRQEPREEAA